MQRVDRGQNHKFGMSHGQTAKIYDWSGSTSATWCCGFRMPGMGVRSDSGFSLYTPSSNCKQCDWLKMAVLLVTGTRNMFFNCLGLLQLPGWIDTYIHADACREIHVSNWYIYIFGVKDRNVNFRGMQMGKKKNERRKDNKQQLDPFLFLWFYFSLYSQELWFTHRWHHGDHSYFYWLVNSQVFSMLCHLSSPHQSTCPWEKKSSTQKWLWVERQNMIHACRATVLDMFHKSNVLSLLLVFYPYLSVLFTHWVQLTVYPIIQYLCEFKIEKTLGPMSYWAPLLSPTGFWCVWKCVFVRLQ